MRYVMHVDFNSYFATVEQQANPRLRGKPIGVTGGPARNALACEAGGDRVKRTVLGAASIEAKKFGVKTGMQVWEAKKLCPQITLVPGDSDKYLEVTKRFLGILKDYSLYLEVFSIDEAFLEISPSVIANPKGVWQSTTAEDCFVADAPRNDVISIAQEIKSRIKAEIGEWITCSVGISYNKLMAKLAGSLQKPDGLIVIPNPEEAVKILDKIELDEICGIGPRIKKRLNNMGVFDFKTLRQVPLASLLASFKSYGQILYNMARGIDYSPIVPFYEKQEVKSIGHRHTIDHDTDDPIEIKQVLLKLTELVARRLRAKNLTGKTIHCWYRKSSFEGEGMQITILHTNDGLEIFKAAWKIFKTIWPARNSLACEAGGNGAKIRMIGVSASNLKSLTPQNLNFLPEVKRKEIITKALDKINDKYGEFTLQRGILLSSPQIRRKPNPFLSDRRFKL